MPRPRPYPPMFRRRGLRGLGGLDPATIQTYAANAGFAGADLSTAVAIARAESSGNPNAYNPESKAPGGTPQGKGSYGLWQIYLKEHPEFAGLNLYDPQTNANAAYSVYVAAGGFSPWATYTAGNYRAFLNAVPVTLDVSTGLPVEDATNVDALQPLQAGILGGDPQNILLLTVLAGGAYLLYDLLSD